MKLKKLLFAVLFLSVWAWMSPWQTVAQVTPADNEIWWGHYLDTDELLGLGSGEAERYDCAIHTGRNNALLSGHRIRAVRFTVQGVSTLQDVKVWLCLGLPDDASNADVVIDVPKEALREGKPTEVLLPTPYTVSTTGVYVGYSMTQTYIGTKELTILHLEILHASTHLRTYHETAMASEHRTAIDHYILAGNTTTTAIGILTALDTDAIVASIEARVDNQGVLT